VQVVISLLDADPVELYSLSAWLQRDDELRGRVSVHSCPQQPDEMGDVASVLSVAVGSGGAAVALITSLTAWLAGKRARISIETTNGGKTRRVEIEGPAPNAGAVEQLLRAAIEASGESKVS
jgi:hypothetical protein